VGLVEITMKVLLKDESIVIPYGPTMMVLDSHDGIVLPCGAKMMILVLSLGCCVVIGNYNESLCPLKMRVLQYLMGQQRRFWFLMKVLFYFLDQQ
jgi:hypothetical protein